MATWGELKNFTYGELRSMNLTYDDLKNLSYDKLLDLAKVRLERFRSLPENIQYPPDFEESLRQLQEFAKVKPSGTVRRLAEAIFAGVIVNAISESDLARQALSKMIQIISHVIGLQ